MSLLALVASGVQQDAPCAKVENDTPSARMAALRQADAEARFASLKKEWS